MKNLPFKSFKRIAIDKATKSVLSALVGAVVVTVFSLVGSRALIGQLRYQNKIISGKEKAVKDLKANIASVESLVEAYKAFDNEAESVIGNNEKNSKIILDALPSKYDFPALATSMNKLLATYPEATFAGSDDELAQQAAGPSQLVEIPINISVTGDYATIQRLIDEINRTIRPMKILSISLSGDQGSMSVSMPITTYYQSEKKLQITTKEVE